LHLYQLRGIVLKKTMVEHVSINVL